MKERTAPRADSAVTNQFGIQPAIVREIDLFRHQPVKHRTDLCSRLIHMNRECRLLANRCGNQRKTRKQGDGDKTGTHGRPWYSKTLSARSEEHTSELQSLRHL